MGGGDTALMFTQNDPLMNNFASSACSSSAIFLTYNLVAVARASLTLWYGMA